MAAENDPPQSKHITDHHHYKTLTLVGCVFTIVVVVYPLYVKISSLLDKLNVSIESQNEVSKRVLNGEIEVLKAERKSYETSSKDLQKLTDHLYSETNTVRSKVATLEERCMELQTEKLYWNTLYQQVLQRDKEVVLKLDGLSRDMEKLAVSQGEKNLLEKAAEHLVVLFGAFSAGRQAKSSLVLLEASRITRECENVLTGITNSPPSELKRLMDAH